MLPGFPVPLMSTQGMSVVGVRNFGTTNGTAGSRIVEVQYPVGTLPNDMVFAIAVGSGPNSGISTYTRRDVSGPEGWAPVVSNGNARGGAWSTSSGPLAAWQVLMRVAQPGDGGFNFVSSRSTRLIVSLITIRNTTYPFDAINQTAAISGGTNTGVTVSTINAMLLLLGGFAVSGTTAPTVTGPGSATELVSYALATSNAGGSRNWIGVEDSVPVGSTGNRVWGENANSNELSVISLSPGVPPTWLYDRASPSSGSWQVPAGVTSVNIMCVGSGGYNAPGFGYGQGGGGACAYTNNIAVTPGEFLTIGVGVSKSIGFQNTEECASYVRRGATTLVLADYGRSADFNAGPDSVGVGGLASNSIGDVTISGEPGFDGANQGGNCGSPFGLPFPDTNSDGYGLSLGGTILGWSTGGTGAGAHQEGYSIAGGGGGVAITWGFNRGFGQGDKLWI